MTFVLIALTLFFASVRAESQLPRPIGKYNVTSTTGSLIDYHNHSHSANPAPRELMLSVFQPATCESSITVPYMPDKTANYQESLLRDLFHASGDISLLLNARLRVCSDNNSPLEDVPIILFSPGYTVPRLYYNIIASEIASHGFVVLTIDHPEDANIITYPDGHAVYNNDTSQHPEAWKEHLPIRAADASFIIDQLNNATVMAELLPQRGHRPLLTDRIAMMGHSLGGAASIIAAGQDTRIQGAINWDGTIMISPPETGVFLPVLLMSREAGNDPSWPIVWPLLKGPKLWVDIANTTHMTFSDVPTLLKAAGEGSEGVEGLLGTIAPGRMLEILVEFTVAWMRMVFENGGEPLLPRMELEDFPEISIVKEDNLSGGG